MRNDRTLFQKRMSVVKIGESTFLHVGMYTKAVGIKTQKSGNVRELHEKNMEIFAGKYTLLIRFTYSAAAPPSKKILESSTQPISILVV